MAITYRQAKGDTAPFVYQIRDVPAMDDQTEPVDLEGLSVTFTMVLDEATEYTILEKPVDIIQPSFGWIQYNWASTDVATCGMYHAWLRTYDAASTATTIPRGEPLWIHIFDPASV